MDCFAASGGLNQAHKLLAQMKEENIPRTDYTYNILLKACTEAHDYRQAIEYLREMRECNLTPSTLSFNSAIDACAECKRLEEAELLFAEMHKWGLLPDTVTFTTMMKAHLSVGSWRVALDFFEAMIERDIKRDVGVYEMIIQGLVNCEEFYEADKLFHSMKNDDSILPRGHKIYDALIKGATRQSEFKTAVQYFHVACEKGLEPSFQSYLHTVASLVELDDLDIAVQLVEEMRQRGTFLPKEIDSCINLIP